MYILLLVPGLVFVFTRERHRPTVRRSAFRETATVVFASAISVAIVAASIALVSLFWPWLAGGLARLIKQEPTFIPSHLAAIFLAGCGFILLASGLAWLLGTERAHRLWSNRPWDKSLVDQDASAWSVIFDQGGAEDVVLVGAQLKSGWWVEGALFTFDNSGDPSPNRTITLTGDLAARGPDAKTAKPIDGYGSLILEAGEIEYMLVAYAAKAPTSE
jgi:hypothetical protein